MEQYRWYQTPPKLEGNLDNARGRLELADNILPKEFSGESLLDIGCAEGIFCIEVAKRGAKDIVGIDKKERRIAAANYLVSEGDENIKFIIGNFEEMSPNEIGFFDYVICLNVLHHVSNLQTSIDKLLALTRKCLVLEIAGLNEKEPEDALGKWRLFFRLIPPRLHPPVIVAGTNGGLCISPRALRQMIIRAGGEDLESIRTSQSFTSSKKNRYLLIANK